MTGKKRQRYPVCEMNDDIQQLDYNLRWWYRRYLEADQDANLSVETKKVIEETSKMITRMMMEAVISSTHLHLGMDLGIAFTESLTFVEADCE